MEEALEHLVALVGPWLLQVLVQEVEEVQQVVLGLLFEHLMARKQEAKQVALESQQLLLLVLDGQLKQVLEPPSVPVVLAPMS